MPRDSEPENHSWIMGKSISVEGLLNDEEQASILEAALEWSFVEKHLPDHHLIRDKQHIVISTENIKPALVPSIPDTGFVPLTPQQIKEKANREGDYLYVNFRWLEASKDRVKATIETKWATSITSHVRGYLSGGGGLLNYRKTNGEWTLEPVTQVWIS